MTSGVDAAYAALRACSPTPRTRIRVALLGVGQVGGAVATLLRESALDNTISIVSGLVRDMTRNRPAAEHVQLTSSLLAALQGEPDVVVEALGGLEPARSLVLSALGRRIPVVTANKSLLARHGDELFDAAARAGVPLRYEAAVLAGVPFLGTFARRPFARDLTGICGIVNGTTNFILSRMALEGTGFSTALADAQQRGYAEPDPASDVTGTDAAEKLCVLLRHFGDWSVRPEDIDTSGIVDLDEHDAEGAREFGGVLKPVVHAEWQTGKLSAFVGPAFVGASHPLARVNGVQNAVVLRNRIAGDLLVAGPGAGPDVTAATLLDDVAEIGGGAPTETTSVPAGWRTTQPCAPTTRWFVRVTGEGGPAESESSALLSPHGVQLRRVSRRWGSSRSWLLCGPCTQHQLASALRALRRATGCLTFCVRVLED